MSKNKSFLQRKTIMEGRIYGKYVIKTSGAERRK